MSHAQVNSESMTDMEEKKRAPPADVEGESSDSEDDFGPSLAANDTQPPPEADEQQAKNKKKKRRRLEHEEVYVAALPNADMYEKSYMHRDVVTLCAFTPKSDFLVTASMDGHVKFWKKMPEGVEFVKHYHAHLGNINGLAVSADGLRLATTGQDKALKFYDVLSFDLSYIVEVDYVPGPCVWIHGASEPHGRLAVADAEGPAIRVYRTDGSNQAVHTIERLHTAPVVAMAYSPVDGIACSTDAKGIIEFWSNDEYTFPRNKLAFKSKLDTDLFELMKRKTRATSVEISSDGTKLAVVGKDKQIRVFSVKKGKLLRVYNESMEVMDAAHATSTLGLDSIDYGRRSATEHELEASPVATLQNAVFDETGHFLIYSTLLGVKIVNIETNRVIKVLGKIESGERFLHVSLFQGTPKVDSQLVKALSKGKAASSVEELRAQIKPDPTICCTSFKKRRFYLFTRRMPDDAADEINGRDVFNERPTAAEAKAVQHQQHELGRQAILRTTMGDIHIKLFRDECPKTVENFTVHSRNQYYDNVLFHRVIKGFMVQTGDPQGDGTGGESIWGGEFQDEFHRNLRHDRPFTVSMANSGPNTNGSQFFITTVPCPWLDNKHTVFGRVVKGMDVIETVSQVKTDHLDRPYEDIKIINVEVL